MARTTRNLVGKIIELDASVVPDNSAMEPFITSASLLVDEACAEAGYTDERLELIERWLTAHLYTIRDPRATSEKAGAVGATFQSKVDLGFDTSHYGQMAMRLDTAGGLAAINEDTKKGKPTVSVMWAGTPAED